MRTPKPCVLPKRPTTRADLLASGMTQQMIRTALGAGRLHRVRRGVFIDAALWPPEPREQHLLRAVAERELFPEGVLSHQSAAAAWQLPRPGFTAWHDLPASITLPRGSRSRTGAVIHHVGTLPPSQVTVDAEGRRLTSLARTAVDVAAGRALPEALVVFDAAARLLCAAMVVGPRRSDYANHRLIAAAREAFEQAALTRPPAGLRPVIALADPCRESAPESLSAGHFHLAGLPRPECQARVNTAVGTLYPDFYWSEQQLIGECDGAVKYTDPSGYVREKEREQVLRDLGYRMVRWQAKEIMLAPAAVIERVSRAFG